MLSIFVPAPTTVLPVVARSTQTPGAQFDAVLDLHGAHLGDLAQTVPVGQVPEAVDADEAAAVQNDIVPQAAALANHHAGMQTTVVADPDFRSDDHVRAQPRAGAQGHPRADDAVRPDGLGSGDVGRLIDHRRGMNARREHPVEVQSQSLQDPGEGVVGAIDPDGGQGAGLVRAHDDRTGPARLEQRDQLLVVQKGQVAGTGFGQGGDTRDHGVAGIIPRRRNRSIVR